MTDRNKFEEMLERLINEDREGAEELFHEIVVEKSRDIYEGLLESDLEEIEEDEEVEESDDDEAVEEATDEEVEESDDEEVEEGFDLDEFEVEADPVDDMMGDLEMGGDDEEGDDEEGEEGEEELEDRVMDIEDALDDLKAEFEKMMAGDDEGDDDMDDMGDDEEAEEAFAFEATDEEVEEADDTEIEEGSHSDQMIKDKENMSKAEFEKKYGDAAKDMDESAKTAGEQMREYVEKVSATMGDTGTDGTKSAVASKNDMGGDAGNLAQGADEKGRSADTAKEDSHGNVNVPGGKASKSMKAQKAPKVADAANKTPIVGK